MKERQGHSVKEGWERKERRMPSSFTDDNSDWCIYCDTLLSYRYYGRLYGVRNLEKEYRRCPNYPAENKGVACYLCDRKRRIYGDYGVCVWCYLAAIVKMLWVYGVILYMIYAAMADGLWWRLHI